MTKKTACAARATRSATQSPSHEWSSSLAREGKFTIALAHACYPEELIAVDTWEGSRDESPENVTVHLAGQGDICGQFLTNIQLLTKGNINPIRANCHQFLKMWQDPIKFCRIDASHDYRSVRRTLGVATVGSDRRDVLRDDILTAPASRQGLDGGVEGAVREMLQGWEQIRNLWLRRKAS